jgi:hypothetical protein
MVMTDRERKGSKVPPAGSARARLEALQKREQLTAPMRRRAIMLFAFLAVLVSGFAVFECRARREQSWFDFYKDSAWMVREGRWDEVKELLSADLTIEGVEIGGRDELLALAKSYGEKGLSLHASHPFAFGEQGDTRWMRYFLTWSRGNLEDRNVVPIVSAWLVHVRMRLEDGVWRADYARVRKTLDAPALPSVATPPAEEGR